MAYVSTPAFGNWFTDVVKAVVPSKTIVGKLLAGDVGGAVAGATKLAVPAKATPAPAVPTAAPGFFSPGGFVDKNQTMLLVAAAGLGAFLLLGRRKGRK